MSRSILNKCLIAIVCIISSACTGMRYLPEGDKLYTGAKVEVESQDELKNRETKAIRKMAKDAVRPKPNKTFMGMRPRIWMYEKAGEDPKGKIKKWLKKNGEPAVLLSNVKPGLTSEIIDAKLFNIGVFKSRTDYDIIGNKQTAKVIYTSRIHEPYFIKEILYSISDDSLSRRILEVKEKSHIKPGKDYKLERLKNERTRIDAALKDRGYFNFNPDYLLFKADTSGLNHTVSLNLTLKDSLPEGALTVYRIHNVFVDQNYSLDADPAEKKTDTIRFDNIIFLGQESDMNIRPNVISRSVYLRKNEIYSRKNHSITLSRLMSMGNFKFIQVKFADSDTTAPGFLNVTILMTPMQKHTFRAEIEMVSKSNNFMGPRMNLSVLDRNTFRGAELLDFSMTGSFEAQLNSKIKNSYSYSWNPRVELSLPLFLFPFLVKGKSNIYVPKTRFLLSYNYLKRVDYFDMQTFEFLFGYKWKHNVRTEFEINPVHISYSSLFNETDKFKELLESNYYLRKSYEEQFISGGSLSFTYNDQMIPGKKIQNFFLGTAEIGGNVLSLAGIIAGNRISSDNPATIAGSVYSQYAKLSLDGRAYYKFTSKHKLALRVFTGIGIPYGNSSTLPYIKQFFSGGPNSIRAFQINSLGPGSYQQDTGQTGFLQLGGDIKLETNVEYRFTIYRFLKAALFADAGNVWLSKSNSSEKGSPFELAGFADDLAVGAGVGLRIDVSFFILRFDLAAPLRKPWLDHGHRWVGNQMSFGDPAWRKENLVLNVAIGYPF
ncbi:MAG: BamA/TamA family outer membrane protein [Bacteroidales bacterium]|nr:BamA/TamA family outer membrane protein [Bacteroidales bacterium]